jgi:hypothetical protein
MAVRHHGVIPYGIPVDHRRVVDLLVRPVWAVLEDRESHSYAAETGPIIGMEVVMAFAVEAGFIGVVLYGDGRVTRGTTQPQPEGLLIDESTTLDASTGTHVLMAIRRRVPLAVLVLAMHELPADPDVLGLAWSTLSLD